MAWEDLLATADRAVATQLGRPIIYAPAVGDPVTVTGVYDDAYVTAPPGIADVATSSPAVFLVLADLPVDPLADDPRITVPANGIAPAAGTFEVLETKPDSAGAGVLLVLRRVA